MTRWVLCILVTLIHTAGGYNLFGNTGIHRYRHGARCNNRCVDGSNVRLFRAEIHMNGMKSLVSQIQSNGSPRALLVRLYADINTGSTDDSSSTGSSKEVIEPIRIKAPINIPNTLTLLRVALIPVFCVLFASGLKLPALLVYLVSCATDFLDGYLARTLKLETALGAFLDPVADKLMVCSALVLLVCQLPVWWFAAPVVLIVR